MKGGSQPAGYTIVEVMIFMAVSGLMFVMAAVLINGKQASVEFKQSMFSVNTDIRTAVNEVANGEYPPLTGGGVAATCSTVGAGAPSFSNVGSRQGTNAGGGAGCIFLGKVLQFDVGGTKTAFNVYTVAARQLDTNGNPVTAFKDALPVAAYKSAGPTLDLTDKRVLKSGLIANGTYVCNNSACSSSSLIGSFGFFGSFNSSLGVASGAAQSGSQSISTAVVPVGAYGDAGGTTINNIASLKEINDPAYPSATLLGNGKFLLLCFKNGNNRGSVTVGGSNGQQFTTEVSTGKVLAPCLLDL